MKKIIIIILLSIALNGEIFADDKVGIPSENVQAKSKDSDNLGTIKAEFSERFLTTSVIIGEVVEAPPYPQAKLYFLIEDKFEDRDWLSNLIRITVKELPEPKPKKKKSGKATQ